MHAIQVNLIGLSETEIAFVADEVAGLGGEIAKHCATVGELTSGTAQSSDRRVLFVVGVADFVALADVHVIADTFPGCPIVVVSRLADNAAFIQHALRAGAVQVVTQANSDDFQVALERSARQFGLEPRCGRIVALTGTTEGSGTTTIALNLAAEAAAVGQVPTILVEVGARLGHLAVLLNCKPPYTMQDLSQGPPIDIASVRRTLHPIRERFSLLAGSYQTIGTVPNRDRLLRLLGILRRLADLVVLDMPYGFDEDYFALLNTVDDIVIVADQKIPSVHGLLVLMAALQEKTIAKLHPVINRFGAENSGASLREIQELLNGPIPRVIHNHSKAVMDAVNRGTLLREQDSRSPILADLHALLAELLHQPNLASPSPEAGWFRRLWRSE